MGILIHPRRWSSKPPPSAEINFGHPLADGLSILILFNEGAGIPRNLVGRFPAMTENGTPTWKTSQAGLVKNLSTTSAYWDLGTASKVLSLDRVTILLIRRKTDTTQRPSVAFGTSGSTLTERCGVHLPYSDATVYWDFGGGNLAPNRTVWGGYSVSTRPELWSFVAGPQGTSIWLNGTKRQGQAIAVTRTTSTETFQINAGNGLVFPGGDQQEFAFFAVYKKQLSASLLQWWAAEPYAMLVPMTRRRYLFPSAPPVVASNQPNVCVATF